jgi:modification methylase
VPFSALIERGLVTPGAKLVDAKKRHKALVRADGAVSFGTHVGSIHKMGAMAQGLEACNGWSFWHVETPKGLKSIDDFRAMVRAEMAEAAE